MNGLKNIKTNKIMKQTAVQWLQQSLSLTFEQQMQFEGLFQQAKEMEKQQQGYSEEEMKSAFKVGFSIGYGSDVHAIDEKNRTCEEWFNKYKKK